jgi:chromatin assembly factor 1 subunit A
LKDGTILYDFKKLSQEKIKQSKEEFDNALGLSSTASEQSHYRDVSLQWLKSQSRQSVEKTKPFTATYVYENQLENTSLEMRFIKFYENVKPYHGTYTKSVTEGLPIDPFLPEEPVFLDFDDEGDENEEGEGEDIDDLDDDEEEEDEEDDDIGDFLEPDSSPTPGNAKITGPLIPKISWKSDNEKEYRIEILKANITIPINPKRNYWEVESSPNTPNKILKGSNSTDSTSSRFKKAKSLITDKQDLETFAQHVNESDYTIPTMVEILKKQLPAYTKSTIENTLKSIAKRVGPKPTEKKWEVNNDLLVELSQQAAAQ